MKLCSFLHQILISWTELRHNRGETSVGTHYIRLLRGGGIACFVAVVATGVGALSSLVIAALWIGPLVLSPCASA